MAITKNRFSREITPRFAEGIAPKCDAHHILIGADLKSS
jgi:hypothetical protein